MKDGATVRSALRCLVAAAATVVLAGGLAACSSPGDGSGRSGAGQAVVTLIAMDRSVASPTASAQALAQESRMASRAKSWVRDLPSGSWLDDAADASGYQHSNPRVSVAVLPQTATIQVTVSASTQTAAAAIAESYAEILGRRIESVEGGSLRMQVSAPVVVASPTAS